MLERFAATRQRAAARPRLQTPLEHPRDLATTTWRRVQRYPRRRRRRSPANRPVQSPTNRGRRFVPSPRRRGRRMSARNFSGTPAVRKPIGLFLWNEIEVDVLGFAEGVEPLFAELA